MVIGLHNCVSKWNLLEDPCRLFVSVLSIFLLTVNWGIFIIIRVEHVTLMNTVCKYNEVTIALIPSNLTVNVAFMKLMQQGLIITFPGYFLIDVLSQLKQYYVTDCITLRIGNI